MKVRFARDSPLKEHGFELSVPVARGRFDLERFCGGVCAGQRISGPALIGRSQAALVPARRRRGQH